MKTKKESESANEGALEDLLKRYLESLELLPLDGADSLWCHLARRLGERVEACLSSEAKRRLRDLASRAEEITVTKKEKEMPRKQRGGFAPGTILQRLWRGTEIRVNVTEAGFELAGKVYPSLTAAVYAATASHWNPRIFFGITPRKRAK
jgi:hypothetical protein